MGWLITLAVLFLLAVLPLGVSVLYDSDGPLVRVIAGPLKIKVSRGAPGKSGLHASGEGERVIAPEPW